MHDDRSIVEQRLARIVRERLDPARHGARVPLTCERWEVPGEPVSVNEALAASYERTAVGEMFGRPWGTTWFRMAGTVPDEWAGATVDASINLGFSFMPGFQSEGLIWAQEDSGEWTPRRGLHPFNHDVSVASPAVGGEDVSFFIEAASNPPIVVHGPDRNSDLLTASTDPMYTLSRAELVVVNTDVVELREDIRALTGLMNQLALDQPRRHEILRALEAALDALALDDIVGTAPAARAALVEVLSRPAVPSAHRISAIGHAHIDSAWLWPIRETVRKCARTFSNVLALMDDDPEFRFGCSQAVQYEWMREHYPSIFERIRERVAEGRWVVIGGMWVEADTNLAGGEALIRQFTHGQSYFEEHFGLTCSEVWIPDVFGYPASLPQIMKTCGFERFLTQKLSWNKTNRFPHHTFWWEGIDGSTVFTHFPPVETYNATFDAEELAHSVRTFTDKGRATRSLMPFGFGDGGGGPTQRMLDQFHRVRDLEGSPRVEIESPEEFFDAAIVDYPDAPRWVGELYFEMHRGTFTSQAGTKAGNRRCELLLREAELWCVQAYGGKAADGYPAAALDRLWKVVLLHQFHDILPGSSIGWVHREAEVAYAEVAAELELIIASALGRLSGGSPILANPAPFPVAGVVVVDRDELADDLPADAQELSDGSVAVVATVGALAVEPAGAAVCGWTGQPSSVTVTPDGGFVLDNGLRRVVLDSDGLIESLFDLEEDRELVASGERANLLQLHQDLPNEYDAWDIEEFYRRRRTDLVDVESVEVIDSGPLVVRVDVTRAFGASRIVQTVELRAGSPRIDVVCDVDWHEREHLLKVAMPLDIHADEMAREIQFGHLRSAIHTNTSWDAARFEVCAHRWADVSEPGYGFALLNDSKYGYDATRVRSRDGDPATVLRLTLLRGTRYPDPEADQGHHRFTYSLLPHRGPVGDGGVIAQGFRLNAPVRMAGKEASPSDAAASAGPFVTVDRPSVVIETMKAADDDSGDIIVRCYESWGGRANARLTFSTPIGAARQTDARERDAGDRRAVVDVAANHVDLTFRPFQIVTLRISG